MKIRCEPSNERGIALAIVMIVVVVLGILAGGFAYSMKVESRLARNNSYEGELEWLGRSGVELARYVLVQQLDVGTEPWDSLNQKWAGGPAGTNEVLQAISLENNRLGNGVFSIRIIDLERKYNINLINEEVLHRAFELVAVDPAEFDRLTDSLLDWLDPDDEPRLAGTESDLYLSQPNPGFPPYIAKNGPVDDLSELLLVRGFTPDMLWGPDGNPLGRAFRSREAEGLTGRADGFADLFTTLSAGALNINTVSAEVLQLLPWVDPALAQAIVMTRAGLDGMDGTEDDVPFRTPGELINVPGMIPQIVQQLQGVLQVRSLTFEVHVDAQLGLYRRRFVAILRRNPGNPRDIQTVSFYWK